MDSVSTRPVNNQGVAVAQTNGAQGVSQPVETAFGTALGNIATPLGTFYDQLVTFVNAFDNDPILTTIVGAGVTGVATGVFVSLSDLITSELNL
jgi:hypothetical protein